MTKIPTMGALTQINHLHNTIRARLAEGGEPDEAPKAGMTGRRGILKGLLGLGAAAAVGAGKKMKIADKLLEVKEELPALKAKMIPKDFHSKVGQSIHEWFNDALDGEKPRAQDWIDGTDSSPDLHSLQDLFQDLHKKTGMDIDEFSRVMHEQGYDPEKIQRMLMDKYDHHLDHESNAVSDHHHIAGPNGDSLLPWEEVKANAMKEYGVPEEFLASSGIKSHLAHNHAVRTLDMLRNPERYSEETIKRYQLENHKPDMKTPGDATRDPDLYVQKLLKGHPMEKDFRGAYEMQYGIPPE